MHCNGRDIENDKHNTEVVKMMYRCSTKYPKHVSEEKHLSSTMFDQKNEPNDVSKCIAFTSDR